MGLRKHTNLASYALGNVIKYRTRSTVIVLALVFSTALLCSTEFIQEGVMQDISHSLDEGSDIVVQRLQGGRQSGVPLDWVTNISNIPGVGLATPRVWGYTNVGGGKLLTIMGVNSTEYGSVLGALGTEILDDGGRFIEEDDNHTMVVGQGIIDLLSSAYSSVQVDLGSKIGLIAENGSIIEFEVVGIFSSDSKIYSYDMILTDINSARELFGIDSDECTDVAVWAEHGVNLNDVAFRIDTRISQSRVLTRDASNDLLMQTYGGRAGIVALLWAVLLMTVVIAAFTVSGGGSEEARQEVGLLKALGFDTVDIIEIRMFESVTLSVLGASLGISSAIIYDFVLGAPILSGYLLGWSLVLLNSGLPLSISPTILFTVYAVALIPILVATVVPAWKNAITEPDVVLRGV